MIKKILIITGIVLAVVLLVFLAKSFFFSNSEVVVEKPEESQSSESSEETSLGARVVKIIESDVKGATLNETSNQILFYQDQKFLLANIEGKIRSSVGDYPFGEPTEILWSATKEKAIIKDKDSFHMFVLGENKDTVMKEGTDEVVWDQKDDKIFYKYFDAQNKKRSLDTANSDGSGWDVLKEGVPYRYISLVSQSKKGENCFFPFPDGKVIGKLECIKLQSKEIRTVLEQYHGADYLWSPDGQKVLISFSQTQAGNRLVAGVMNDDGGEFVGLNFPTTVRKCAWASDNKSVYCSMMGSVPEQAVLPNDWHEKKYDFNDLSIWKINTGDGKKERVVDATEFSSSVDGENFFLDSQEKYLFFTDRISGGLYRISL